MGTTYLLQVAGLERELPVCRITDDLYIGAFVIFGDIELTQACAEALLRIAPPYDILITADSKGIPLVYEMARQRGDERHVIARKAAKLYMKDVVSAEVRSITTDRIQTLYLDGGDVEHLRGRRVLIVDDVISTGESLRALEELVDKAGGEIVGRMAILAEGEAGKRNDIQYLAYLPLLNADGTPKD
ncbi:MAG: adenine phosphoribosyltransferase [Clostridiaceae bacterium]|jgi:adenine phosphoribosyltransferase|nr:adenine phosphoribosyltransferase [Clostridiaceae bacterium]